MHRLKVGGRMPRYVCFSADTGPRPLISPRKSITSNWKFSNEENSHLSSRIAWREVMPFNCWRNIILLIGNVMVMSTTPEPRPQNHGRIHSTRSRFTIQRWTLSFLNFQLLVKTSDKNAINSLVELDITIRCCSPVLNCQSEIFSLYFTHAHFDGLWAWPIFILRHTVHIHSFAWSLISLLSEFSSLRVQCAYYVSLLLFIVTRCQVTEKQNKK